MKLKQSTKPFSGKSIFFGQRIITYFTVLTALLFFQVNTAQAEGSGKWGVTANRQVNLFVPATATSSGVPGGGNTGYVARGFMMLASTTGSVANPYNPAHRLYVWVKSGETVFWGFRGTSGSNVTFDWYYDNNSVTNTGLGYFPSATTTANGRVSAQSQSVNVSGTGAAQGRPADASAATNGPQQVTGSGYNAYSFTNNTGAARAFWVEINSNNLEFNFWDITVASGTTGSYSRKTGRVYCKYWSVVNELPNVAGSARSDGLSFPASFGFYVPIDNTNTSENDFYVKSVNFGGSNAGYAIFYANADGPRNNQDFDLNRRSIAGAFSTTQYPLFLNIPDASVWPEAPLPKADYTAVFSKKPDSPGGQATFHVTIDNPSIVDILIDLNENGFYDGNDVLISQQFDEPGTYDIYWNGKNGAGADVPSGTSVFFISSLVFYPVHFPIYDMEQCLGITIKHVRPLRAPTTEPTNDVLYWDDTGLTRANIASTSTMSPRSVERNVTGQASPQHIWWATADNGFGNNNTVNTWTGGFNDKIVRELLFNYDSDVDLAVVKTVDAVAVSPGQTVTFTIEATNLPVATNETPVTASGVEVTDAIPAGYSVVDVTVSKGSWSTAASTWIIGTLDENEKVTMTVKATVNATGSYLNTALIQGNENDVNFLNNQDDAMIVIGRGISGNVFNDPNGGHVNNSTGAVNNIPDNLFANLLDADGNVVASTTIDVGGTYSFANMPPATYTVKLSNATGTAGSPPPAYLAPDGWENTGTYNGNVNTGNSGNKNGLSETFTVSNTDVENINFGIQHIPTAYPDIDIVKVNPGETNNAPVDPDLFTGTDPDGGYISAIVLTKFPDQATSITIDGVKYTSFPDIVAAYPGGIPASQQGNPTVSIDVDPVDGEVDVVITYRVLDNFGSASTEATVTLPFSSPAMPVRLIFFKATGTEGSVSLKWQTQTEQNSLGFAAERSRDARSWEGIGWVPAAGISGNSSYVLKYNFDDHNPLKGINYYRLKMIDLDGTYAYSPIVKCEIKELISTYVYPNPVTDQNDLRILGLPDGNEGTGMTIYDLKGKVVAVSKKNKTGKIDTKGITNGVYLLVVKDKKGQVFTFKFSILR